MWKLIPIGLTSLLSVYFTVLIQFTPNLETQIGICLIFGLVLGIPWLIKGLEMLIGGLITGTVAGVCVVIILAIINDNISMVDGPDKALLVSLKIILPLIIYSGVGSFPWVLV